MITRTERELRSMQAGGKLMKGEFRRLPMAQETDPMLSPEPAPAPDLTPLLDLIAKQQEQIAALLARETPPPQVSVAAPEVKVTTPPAPRAKEYTVERDQNGLIKAVKVTKWEGEK